MVNKKERQKKAKELVKHFKREIGNVCGESKSIAYDNRISMLNVELIIDKQGSPCIELQDWTKHERSRKLVRLHIHEAIELKAIIDKLLMDYHDDRLDNLEGR